MISSQRWHLKVVYHSRLPTSSSHLSLFALFKHFWQENSSEYTAVTFWKGDTLVCRHFFQSGLFLLFRWQLLASKSYLLPHSSVITRHKHSRFWSLERFYRDIQIISSKRIIKILEKPNPKSPASSAGGLMMMFHAVDACTTYPNLTWRPTWTLPGLAEIALNSCLRNCPTGPQYSFNHVRPSTSGKSVSIDFSHRHPTETEWASSDRRSIPT